jgi:hypothetical protein
MRRRSVCRLASEEIRFLIAVNNARTVQPRLWLRKAGGLAEERKKTAPAITKVVINAIAFGLR